MQVQERLEQLKRQKTPYATEELDRRGWRRYAEIRAELEAQHYGEFVMIEVDSGDYFIGATSQEALQRARKVHPDKAFCLIRIGYKAVRKLRVR
jgi:predicted nucleic acid-binding protein